MSADRRFVICHLWDGHTVHGDSRWAQWMGTTRGIVLSSRGNCPQVVLRATLSGGGRSHLGQEKHPGGAWVFLE